MTHKRKMKTGVVMEHKSRSLARCAAGTTSCHSRHQRVAPETPARGRNVSTGPALCKTLETVSMMCVLTTMLGNLKRVALLLLVNNAGYNR
jgi:hypothetical protein